MAWHGTKAVGLVAVAFCSKLQQQRYLTKYQKYPSGRLPGSCNHSLRPIQSTFVHAHSHTHNPSTSTPSLLSTCLVAATALHCCNCCCHPRCLSCASFFSLSGRLLSRPAFFGALLLNPKKDGFRETVSRFPLTTCIALTPTHLFFFRHPAAAVFSLSIQNPTNLDIGLLFGLLNRGIRVSTSLLYLLHRFCPEANPGPTAS